MLNSVKKALRITTDSLDDELSALITACKQELSANKIDIFNENFSELISLAVKHFCKANFGDSFDSEKHQKCYESLKGYLMTACGKE